MTIYQDAAAVCHPMHFEGSTETLGDDIDGSSYSERDREDHDGFFEPWSREKLGISSDDKLEIIVGFLAVNYTPGTLMQSLPVCPHDRVLYSVNILS